MDNLFNFLALGVIVFYLLSGILIDVSEPKCPICGSTRHWKQRYWGSDKYYDNEYICAKCQRALHDISTDEFKTFDEPQSWLY